MPQTRVEVGSPPTAAGDTAVGKRSSASPRKKLLTFLFKGYQHEIYGGERSLTLMLSYLSKFDPVVVVNRDDAVADHLRRAGVAVVVFPSEDLLSGFRALTLQKKLSRAITWLSMNRRVLALIRNADPDVIHCNDWAEYFHLAPALLASRRPVVLHLRCEVGMRWHHQLALASASLAISVSKGIEQKHHARATRLLRRAIERRSRVLHNGIDLRTVDAAMQAQPREKIRERLGIGSEDVAVVCVGAIEPRKRQRDIIRHVASAAIGCHPTVRFFFIGGEKNNPYYASQCRQLIDEQHLNKRVELCGYRKDVFDWYAASDIVLLGSEREGLPRCLIEALSFGVPVVACDIPGVRDLIEDGQNGFVVPERDFSQMHAAVLLLAGDAAVRRRLGQRGRAIAEAKFKVETCAASFENLLLQVTTHKSVN
jgi:glycosyltransferase involved in cell wall biosynthesis